MAISWSPTSEALAESPSGISERTLVGIGAALGIGLSVLPPKVVRDFVVSDRPQPSPKSAARLVPLKAVNTDCNGSKYVLADIGAILSPNAIVSTPIKNQMAVDALQPPPSPFISGFHTVQKAGRRGTDRAAATVKWFCHDGEAHMSYCPESCTPKERSVETETALAAPAKGRPKQPGPTLPRRERGSKTAFGYARALRLRLAVFAEKQFLTPCASFKLSSSPAWGAIRYVVTGTSQQDQTNL